MLVTTLAISEPPLLIDGYFHNGFGPDPTASTPSFMTPMSSLMLVAQLQAKWLNNPSTNHGFQRRLVGSLLTAIWPYVIN